MKKSSETKNTKARRTLTPGNKIDSQSDGTNKPTAKEDALRLDREAVMHDQFRTYQKTIEP